LCIDVRCEKKELKKESERWLFPRGPDTDQAEREELTGEMTEIVFN